MRYTVNKNGCWLFSGPIGKDGYGKVSLKDMSFRAHRLMAHLTIKPIMSADDVVAHKCDTPACINPEHLFITTALGNSQDRDAKRRGAIGVKSHLSKLTEQQVKDIRAQYQSGKSMGEISKSFPVTYGAVQAIVRGRTWKHLT